MVPCRGSLANPWEVLRAGRGEQDTGVGGSGTQVCLWPKQRERHEGKAVMQRGELLVWPSGGA